MSVSVVVPTHNRAPRLEACIRAVLADEAATQVVVVDDGSRDATPALLERLSREDPRVQPVRTEGGGPSTARQTGLNTSTGDVVLMIDDDVILSPGTVSGHRDRHAESDVELILVGYMPTDLPTSRRPGQFATYFYAREYERRVLAWEQGADVLDRLWLGNVSALRSTWRRATMSDPHFPTSAHEDRALGLRMREAGMVGRFDRSLHGRHVHERTLDEFLRTSYRQGLDRWYLTRIHGVEDAEASALGEDLPWAIAAVLRWADSEAGFRVADGGLRWVVRVAGQARLWFVEETAARVLRRMALRRGARAHLHDPGQGEPG